MSSLDNMKVKDLPKPGQYWRWKEERCRIESLFTKDRELWLTWLWVNDTGSIVWKKAYTAGSTVTCSKSMNLEQWLAKAKRE